MKLVIEIVATVVTAGAVLFLLTANAEVKPAPVVVSPPAEATIDVQPQSTEQKQVGKVEDELGELKRAVKEFELEVQAKEHKKDGLE